MLEFLYKIGILSEPIRSHKPGKTYQQRATELFSREEEFEVGKAKVVLTFKDGKKFIQSFEGHVLSQTFSAGRDENEFHGMVEPFIYKPVVVDALSEAKHFIKSPQRPIYVNEDGTKSYSGKVVKAELYRVIPFKITTTVYRLRKRTEEE